MTTDIVDKDIEAQKLAEAHYSLEAGITHIFRVIASGQSEQRPDEPIKLLEVNQHTVSSGIMPLHFSPVPEQGIHFPCIIVEVTPEEFQRLQSKELKLPTGWAIGEALLRPSGA